MTETKVYCDRCKNEINHTVRVLGCHNVVRVLDWASGTEYETLDLCPACMRGFHNFMEKSVQTYEDITKDY